MEVLSGPWADLALLLRQTVTLLPLRLFVMLLFLSVCLLLLQLLIYLNWKLRQVEADLSRNLQDRSAIYRPVSTSSPLRKRSVGSHSYS